MEWSYHLMVESTFSHCQTDSVIMVFNQLSLNHHHSHSPSYCTFNYLFLFAHCWQAAMVKARSSPRCALRFVSGAFGPPYHVLKPFTTHLIVDQPLLHGLGQGSLMKDGGGTSPPVSYKIQLQACWLVFARKWAIIQLFAFPHFNVNKARTEGAIYCIADSRLLHGYLRGSRAVKPRTKWPPTEWDQMSGSSVDEERERKKNRNIINQSQADGDVMDRCVV